MVGVDGSAESVAALSWAGRYATAAGAPVRAVHAWHYPTAASVPPVGVAPKPVTDEVEANIRNNLAEAVAKARLDPSVRVDTEIVYGHPAQVLIDESEQASLLGRAEGAWGIHRDAHRLGKHPLRQPRGLPGRGRPRRLTSGG